MYEKGARSVELFVAKGRSPFWIDVATAVSVGLGVAEAVLGGMGNSNALLANATENLDNITYGLDSIAARREYDRRLNHRLRRGAGALITLAATYVAGNSIYDLYYNKYPTVPSELAGLSVGSAVLDGVIAAGLSKHAQPGTTHRDAFRHSSADTISSVIAAGAIVASSHGFPTVDAYTGLVLSGWTILMTFPTNSRIKNADNLFVNSINPTSNLSDNQPKPQV